MLLTALILSDFCTWRVMKMRFTVETSTIMSTVEHLFKTWSWSLFTCIIRWVLFLDFLPHDNFCSPTPNGQNFPYQMCVFAQGNLYTGRRHTTACVDVNQRFDKLFSSFPTAKLKVDWQLCSGVTRVFVTKLSLSVSFHFSCYFCRYKIANISFTVFSYLCFISSTLSRWDRSAAIQELFSFLGIGTKQTALAVVCLTPVKLSIGSFCFCIFFWHVHHNSSNKPWLSLDNNTTIFLNSSFDLLFLRNFII